jgi:hypothetical protein
VGGKSAAQRERPIYPPSLIQLSAKVRATRRGYNAGEENLMALHMRLKPFQHQMASTLPPLEPRNITSGLAKRTLKNLDFIHKAFRDKEDVHPVTQAVNSLLGLLVFPVEKEKKFFEKFSHVKFDDSSDLRGICTTLTEHLPVPSLKVTKFERCPDLGEFFRKVRNAVSHKNLEFSNTDPDKPDSKSLAEVLIKLRDQPFRRGEPSGPVDWEITVTAEDLEKLSRYVANKVIEGL